MATVGWFDRMMGVDPENVAAGDAADAQLRALNRANYEKGIISEDVWQFTNADINSTSNDLLLSDPKTSVWGGFQEGLQNGADSIRKATEGVLGVSATTFLKLIPWQLWLAGAAFGAWWIYQNFGKRR